MPITPPVYKASESAVIDQDGHSETGPPNATFAYAFWFILLENLNDIVDEFLHAVYIFVSYVSLWSTRRPLTQSISIYIVSDFLWQVDNEQILFAYFCLLFTPILIQLNESNRSITYLFLLVCFCK